MYDGYVNAAIAVFGVQKLVVDRYNIAKLYRKPIDKLRISEMARLKKELKPEEDAKLDVMMCILRKKHKFLSEADKNKLQVLYKHSPKLNTFNPHFQYSMQTQISIGKNQSLEFFY